MQFSLTKRSLHVIFILTTVLFFSCQKDLSTENGIGIQPPDLATKVNSSVSGFVTDENDAAVIGATVQFGTSSTTTDKYGYFEVKNVQVTKNAAFVTVNKPGYFKGIKTYMATAGKSAFFRIKLIPKTNVGNINGISGGTVNLSNGLSIVLPAGAVVNAATNAAYTGTVNVAAFWINPEAADLNSIMPGDLRGIDKDGSLKLLKTFGMAAVELTGASGELLQIATGKKATLTLPIPASLSATAPASIPLWYFDETNGLWKEEGSAAKTGSNYVGDVIHFSFWNYDMPGNYIQLDCTLKDALGTPLSCAMVKLTVVGTNNSAWGFTDGTGYVGGAVPPNSQLLLEVFSDFCTTALYTQPVITGNVNISLGVITISSNVTATISGTVTDCGNLAVTNGKIVFFNGMRYSMYPLTNTGSFSFSVLVCANTPPATIIAMDLTSLQSSNPVTLNIIPGNNSTGNIVACGNTIPEFMHFTLNATNYYFDSPPDYIMEYWYSGLPSNADINIWANSTSNTYAGIRFKQPNIAPNSNQDLISFFSSAISDSLMATSPVPVHITEYGNIGQYISGNFSGTLTSFYNPAITYLVTCNFRTKRAY